MSSFTTAPGVGGGAAWLWRRGAGTAGASAASHDGKAWDCRRDGGGAQINNELLNELLQILLCTIWIDKGSF